MDKRKLPSKEANLFRQVLKYYENKQFRKALKAADQILKKFPEHGETLSMKGLTMNYLDRKDEAYELVRKGLKMDISSHIWREIGWHVYGLLHRAHKNYDEAIKCYLNALRIDKNNLQILRDLSVLQIHSRNLEGFLQTRHDFLNIRPSQRASWIGLALAYHLLNRHSVSIRVLDSYFGTLPAPNPYVWDIELSEMQLYLNQLLLESGKLKEALEHLDKVKDQICDPQAVDEIRAQIYLQMRNFPDAEAQIRKLLDGNPENFGNYTLLEQSLGIADPAKEDDGQRAKLIEMYDGLAAKYPKAHAPARIVLNYAVDEDFRSRVDKYLQFWLRKGAPSLFSNLKSLYCDASKIQAISELLAGYLENLKKFSRFSPSRPEGDEEIPTTLLWTLYYAAQHFDKIGNATKAIEYIDQCIEHTPTMVETSQCKGRIYKHAGDMKTACEFVNKARELDLQDRFINAKCAKYLIRADRIQEAEDVISLFTKGDTNDLPTIFVDMQYLWYTVEAGWSYFRQRQYGKALKKFHQMEKHFEDITDDQFDFHTYCMQRKLTLRSYVRLIRLEDRLRSHRFYVEAARGAIQCYLFLYQHPEAAHSTGEQELAHLSEEDRKKMVSKQRKAEAKAKAQEQESKANNSQNLAAAKKPTDADPDGKLLLETKTPLEEATKFLKPLLQLLPNEADVHELAADVYLAKKKYLLALRALKRQYALSPDSPALHRHCVQFRREVEGLQDANATVKQVLLDESRILFGDASLAEFNQSFLTKHAKSSAHVLAAAETMYTLDPTKKLDALALIEALPVESLKVSIDISKSLATVFGDSAAAETYGLKAREWFPLAAYFAPKVTPASSTSTDSPGPSAQVATIIENNSNNNA